MKKKLQTKITLIITLIWLVGSASLIFLSYQQLEKVLESNIRTRLADYASLGALMIPAGEHSLLRSREDEALPEYRDIVARLRRIKAYNPDIAFAYTVRKTADGNIIFVVDGAENEDDLSHLADVYDDAGPLLRQSAGGLDATVVEKDFYRDKWGTFLSAYAPVTTPDGKLEAILCIDMSLGSINAVRYGYIMKLLLLMLASFVLIVPVSRALARHIVLPVTECLSLTRLLATNDYSRDVPVHLSRRKDEIGELGAAYGTMVNSTRSLVRTIKSETGILSDIGSDLSQNMNETAASINEINGSIQSIRDQTLSQSESVSETLSTMDAIIGNLVALKKNIERQAVSVDQSSSAIEEMIANTASVSDTLSRNAGNVKELALASDSGRSDLAEVSDRIRSVARESEGLLEISEVIQSIASQTNLLAMNAAIEAAHAGDAGKGFSVVADEIRKLAESSGEQSKTITDSLKRIRDAMDRITQATDSVLGQFESIDAKIRIVSEREDEIRNSISEQNSGGREILVAVGELKDITGKVQSEFEEMMTGSRGVIEHSVKLNRITEEVTSRINEMAAGVAQITVAVNLVNETSQTNQSSIGSLRAEVDRFRTEEEPVA
jgi:Methyl-accepting chemotaxis protein